VANHQKTSPMTQSTRSTKLIPYCAATTAQTTVEVQQQLMFDKRTGIQQATQITIHCIAHSI